MNVSFHRLPIHKNKKGGRKERERERVRKLSHSHQVNYYNLIEKNLGLSSSNTFLYIRKEILIHRNMRHHSTSLLNKKRLILFSKTKIKTVYQ